MASSLLATVDPRLWAGLEPFPLGLFSDGNRDTVDLSLLGSIVPGGAYSYSLTFVPDTEYRFSTSPADDGFAERAMVVERASGGVVWANPAALQGFGYDATSALKLAQHSVSVDSLGAYMMVVWADSQVPAGSSYVEQPFRVDVNVDPLPITDNAIYRFLDTYTGALRLTASAEVRDALVAQASPNLRYDGAVFVGDDKPRDGWVPVWEVLDYVTGRRTYTTSAAERDAVVAADPAAASLGAAFWVPGEAGEHTQSVYRMTNLDTGNTFVTSNLTERIYLLLQGNWSDGGVAFQAWVPPVVEPASSLKAEPAGGPAADDAAAIVGVASAPPADFGA